MRASRHVRHERSGGAAGHDRRAMTLMAIDDRAEAHIDAALEQLARPAPPGDHVARVLARTAGRADAPHRAGVPVAWMRPQWLVPIAASVVVALGAFWQVSQIPLVLPKAVQTSGSSGVGDQTYSWGTPREVDRPVLPPQAYWAMDPFEEFRTLRPGRR